MRTFDCKTAVIILAAGLGTRMNSDMAKVLHCVGNRPMINHVLETALDIHTDQIVVVTGYQSDRVRDVITKSPIVSFAYQENQLGTGHAVQCAMPLLQDGIENVIILCGDVPLLKAETVAAFVCNHEKQKNVLTVLAVRVLDPTGYGRMVVDPEGNLKRIVEQADATEEEQAINLINSGIYCVNRSFLKQALDQLQPDNAQGELYLTDIISIASEEGLTIGLYTGGDSEEVIGVNSVKELELAERILNRRKSKIS